MRIKSLLLFFGALALSGCSSISTNVSPVGNQLPVRYPDLGEAPELNNEIWINTSEPLRLADLRGNVILLDMWTFG